MMARLTDDQILDLVNAKPFQLDTFRQHIQAGRIDPRASIKGGFSLLYIAAIVDNVSLARVLLEEFGVDANSERGDVALGRYPLDAAFERDETGEMVRLLIQHGARTRYEQATIAENIFHRGALQVALETKLITQAQFDTRTGDADRQRLAEEAAAFSGITPAFFDATGTHQRISSNECPVDESLASFASRWRRIDSMNAEIDPKYRSVLSLSYNCDFTTVRTPSHQVEPEQDMMSVADRYNEILELSVEAAARRIAAFNGVGHGDPLEMGQTIKIPLPANRQIVYHRVTEADTLATIGNQYARSMGYYGEKSTMGFYGDVEGAIQAICEVNGFDFEEMKQADFKIPISQTIIIPTRHDFASVPLLPPTSVVNHNPIDVLVTESTFLGAFTGGEAHHKETSRVSRLVAAGLAGSDAAQRIWATAEEFVSRTAIWNDFTIPDNGMDHGLRVLMRTPQSQRGNIIFSYSIGTPSDKGRGLQYGGSLESKNEIAEFDFWQNMNVHLYHSVGNDYANGDRYADDHSYFHTASAVEVGASGAYDRHNFSVAGYSNMGADILAPMVFSNGKMLHGTSFAAPFMAGAHKVMAERYGRSETLPHGLGFDDILAAAMMSARRDSLMAKDAQAETDIEPVVFAINGGGLPFHFRAGAGVVDVLAWNQAAEEMVMLSRERGLQTTRTEHRLGLGDPVQLEMGGNTQYVYRITAPAAMTMGRITLSLAQEAGEKGRVMMRSPSGNMVHIHQSQTGLSSTRAFMLEDIQPGQTIVIRSEKPLKPESFLQLRGWEPGSAISALRDKMIGDGRLPAPHHTTEVCADCQYEFPVQVNMPAMPAVADRIEMAVP